MLLIKGVGGGVVLPKVAEISETASGFSALGTPVGITTQTFTAITAGYPSSLTTPAYPVENEGAPLSLTTPTYTSTSFGEPTPLTIPVFVVSSELEVST